MPRITSLNTLVERVLTEAGQAAASAMDQVRGLVHMQPFGGEHLIIDVYLPTPRLALARQLISADLSGYCPIPPQDAALALAGPAGTDAHGGLWRYRLALVHRSQLADSAGRTVTSRRLTDRETGLTLHLPLMRRGLLASEGRPVLAGAAILSSLIWASFAVSVWLERSGEAAVISTRTLSNAAAELSAPPARRHLERLVAYLGEHDEPVKAALISATGSAARLVYIDDARGLDAAGASWPARDIVFSDDADQSAADTGGTAP